MIAQVLVVYNFHKCLYRKNIDDNQDDETTGHVNKQDDQAEKATVTSSTTGASIGQDDNNFWYQRTGVAKCGLKYNCFLIYLEKFWLVNNLFKCFQCNFGICVGDFLML
jgi:hypothetical protein